MRMEQGSQGHRPVLVLDNLVIATSHDTNKSVLGWLPPQKVSYGMDQPVEVCPCQVGRRWG